VIFWFQILLSQSNLYRYLTGVKTAEQQMRAAKVRPNEVGAVLYTYKLNPVDPQLESIWFQPLNL
jgi:hypothetical protein